MKKIRIAVIGTRGFPGVQGGVEAHCQELYPRLAASGCKVTIFARRGYVDPDIKTWQGVKIVPLWSPRRKSLEAILHTLWGSLQIIGRRKQYDVVHMHAIGPSLFVPLIRLAGLPVVVTNHGPDYNRHKWGYFAKKTLRLGEWAGTSFASAVICVSRHIQDSLKKDYGRTTFYIPNGVVIPQKVSAGDTLKQYNLKPGNYALTVGRLVPEKGFHDLVEAFSKISTDWKLVIAGAADHEDEYSRTIKARAGENSNIVMTGFIKGMPLAEIFSNAGLFVLPSYHEGLPIVILEAMSYELPVLATNIPANLELVVDREFTFPPGDRAALTAKLIKLMRPPLENSKFALENKGRLEAEFNWERIATETYTVYKRVIGIAP